MFKNAISLYTPLNTYKAFAERIGVVDGPLVYMAYPGLAFLNIPFPTRMTVIELGKEDELNVGSQPGPMSTDCWS
jgi:hypothetical protein